MRITLKITDYTEQQHTDNNMWLFDAMQQTRCSAPSINLDTATIVIEYDSNSCYLLNTHGKIKLEQQDIVLSAKYQVAISTSTPADKGAYSIPHALGESIPVLAAASAHGSNATRQLPDAARAVSASDTLAFLFEAPFLSENYAVDSTTNHETDGDR